MKQVLTSGYGRKSYDGKVVLGYVTLAFSPEAKIGVVGPCRTSLAAPSRGENDGEPR